MTARVTVAQLEALIQCMGEASGQLEARVEALEAKLEAASTWATKAQAHITTLEAQDVKTRKQLWYLQKVAKGIFDGTKQAA